MGDGIRATPTPRGLSATPSSGQMTAGAFPVSLTGSIGSGFGGSIGYSSGGAPLGQLEPFQIIAGSGLTGTIGIILSMVLASVSSPSTVSAITLGRTVSLAPTAITANSTATAETSAAKPLTPGAIAGASTISGNLEGNSGLTPQGINAASAASGSLTAILGLAPVGISTTSAVSGAIRGTFALAPAAITAASTASATIDSAGQVSIPPDAITSASTVTAAILVSKPLAPTAIVSTSAMSGSLDAGGEIDIPADPITSVSTVTGELGALKPLVPAAIASASVVSGSLLASRPLVLAGINSAMIVSAELDALKPLVPAAITSTSTVSGSITVPGGPSLADTGLSVRYYLDEAASGTTPTDLIDASGVGSAYDLPLVYDGNLAFTEDGSGNRGLNFTSVSGADRAERAIDNTSDKIRDTLVGEQKITLEWVGDFTSFTTSYSRLLVINNRTGGNPLIGVSCPNVNGTGSRIHWNEVHVRSFDLPQDGVHVWHLVHDTTEAVESDRIKLYKDGGAVSLTSIATVTGDSTFAMSANVSLYIGNRENSGTWARSFVGKFYYGAIYAAALTPTEVTNNATILATDNDTPPDGSSALTPQGITSTSVVSAEVLASRPLVLAGVTSASVVSGEILVSKPLAPAAIASASVASGSFLASRPLVTAGVTLSSTASATVDSTPGAPAGIVLSGLTVYTSTDISSPTDIAHTVDADTDLLVVMIQGYASAMTVSGSWNGGTESMTEIPITAGTWVTDQQFVLVLANPTAGTDNVTLDFSASFDDGGIVHIFNLKGVDLTVGTDGVRAHDAAEEEDPMTLSPTVADGDLIVSQWSTQATTNLGATYGGTSGAQEELDATAFNGDVAFLTKSLATGSGQTVTWEPDAGSWPSGVSLSFAKLVALPSGQLEPQGITAGSIVSGGLNVSKPLVLAGVGAGSVASGSFLASRPLVPGAITSASVVSGDLAGTSSLSPQAIASTSVVSGSFSVSRPLTLAAITCGSGASGSLLATRPLVTAPIAPTSTSSASITSTLALIPGSVTSASTASGEILASRPLVLAGATSASVVSGSFLASRPLALAAITSASTVSGEITVVASGGDSLIFASGDNWVSASGDDIIPAG